MQLRFVSTTTSVCVENHQWGPSPSHGYLHNLQTPVFYFCAHCSVHASVFNRWLNSTSWRCLLRPMSLIPGRAQSRRKLNRAIYGIGSKGGLESQTIHHAWRLSKERSQGKPVLVGDCREGSFLAFRAQVRSKDRIRNDESA